MSEFNKCDGMNSIFLHPCPFCGGEARLYVDHGVQVVCRKCGARSRTARDDINIKYSGNAVVSVINAWNSRSYKIANLDEVEEIV